MPHDLKSTNQESSDDEAFTAGDGIYDEELSIKILTIKIVGSNVLNDDGGSYAAYNIATTLSNGQLWNVWRRYSEFVSFHSELKKEGVTGRPALPQKKWLGNLEPEFIQKRVKELEAYVSDVLRMPQGQKLFSLRNFLQPALRKDWPSAMGPIDLKVHDGPHRSSVTEWWYFNSHVTTTTAQR